MRVLLCDEQRMLRVLQGRWPFRRSHCRPDLHWLVRVPPRHAFCSDGRTRTQAGLRAFSRRP